VRQGEGGGATVKEAECSAAPPQVGAGGEANEERVMRNENRSMQQNGAETKTRSAALRRHARWQQPAFV